MIAVATLEVQDYLWTMRGTLGRMSEVNRLTWEEVDFKQFTVTLYTKKKERPPYPKKSTDDIAAEEYIDEKICGKKKRHPLGVLA